MPLPSPRGREDKDAFISRCVSELSHKDEFDSQKQRVAVCFQQWRDAKGESTMNEKSYKCPDCGTKVMEKTDYFCVKCQEKKDMNKKESFIEDFDVEEFMEGTDDSLEQKIDFDSDVLKEFVQEVESVIQDLSFNGKIPGISQADTYEIDGNPVLDYSLGGRQVSIEFKTPDSNKLILSMFTKTSGGGSATANESLDLFANDTQIRKAVERLLVNTRVLVKEVKQ